MSSIKIRRRYSTCTQGEHIEYEIEVFMTEKVEQVARDVDAALAALTHLDPAHSGLLDMLEYRCLKDAIKASTGISDAAFRLMGFKTTREEHIEGLKRKLQEKTESLVACIRKRGKAYRLLAKLHGDGFDFPIEQERLKEVNCSNTGRAREFLKRMVDEPPYYLVSEYESEEFFFLQHMWTAGLVSREDAAWMPGPIFTPTEKGRALLDDGNTP